MLFTMSLVEVNCLRTGGWKFSSKLLSLWSYMIYYIWESTKVHKNVALLPQALCARGLTEENTKTPMWEIIWSKISALVALTISKNVMFLINQMISTFQWKWESSPPLKWLTLLLLLCMKLFAQCGVAVWGCEVWRGRLLVRTFFLQKMQHPKSQQFRVCMI